MSPPPTGPIASAWFSTRPRGARRLLAAFVLAMGAVHAAPARADANADKAAAQVLFDEGRRLMGEGKLAEACPKLAESQRLDPGVGTQFNLSDCYERLGRTASAWAGFLEVAAAARAAGQLEREQVARKRAAALEARLSKLTIAVPPSVASVTGLEVRRDGERIGAPLFGVAVPVDPGPHEIAVAAPGRAPFRATVEVKPEHDLEVVNVPELAVDSAAASSAPAPSGSSPVALSGSSPLTAGTAGATLHAGPPVADMPQASAADAGAQQRRLALVFAGAGVVGLGVGTVFAVQAKHRYNDSLADCRPDDHNLCNDAGVSKREDARSSGNVATVTYGIGLGLLAVAAFEWITAPPASLPRAEHAIDVKVSGLLGGNTSVAVSGVF